MCKKYKYITFRMKYMQTIIFTEVFLKHSSIWLRLKSLDQVIKNKIVLHWIYITAKVWQLNINFKLLAHVLLIKCSLIARQIGPQNALSRLCTHREGSGIFPNMPSPLVPLSEVPGWSKRGVLFTIWTARG